ncbi:UNVERIFIED_CONTAM: hypothetical protein K2H54_019679 [Gekko kuhli]
MLKVPLSRTQVASFAFLKSQVGSPKTPVDLERQSWERPKHDTRQSEKIFSRVDGLTPPKTALYVHLRNPRTADRSQLVIPKIVFHLQEVFLFSMFSAPSSIFHALFLGRIEV